MASRRPQWGDQVVLELVGVIEHRPAILAEIHAALQKKVVQFLRHCERIVGRRGGGA
jgi:hypothetical protein